ncbi:MAG: hypothetical protein IJT02_03605 [Synergistaceae bacterium]|nr:hypothetical protein [Synergistaceae bacterium]
MLGNVRGYIARKASQHVEVHTLDEAFVTELVEARTTRRAVSTYTLTQDTAVAVHTADLHADHKCTVSGFKVKRGDVSARGFRVKLYTKHDAKVRGLPPRRKTNIFSGLKRMQAMPIELEDKLKFQRNRPAVLRNEVIIAWYWPIVDNAVIKLALNKQRGTLLVWYKPGSRHGKAKGLYLIRRLGQAKPEWRWV